MGFAVMGEISAEPSMEEILSSIKRIIAEEGDGTQTRGRRARPAPQPIEPEPEEVLELSDPMPMADRTPRTPKSPVLTSVDAAPEPRHPESRQPTAKPQPAAETTAEPIVSRHTAAATRAPLEALTRMMVKPETGNDGTLEGLVREMLRPMLREWIDANLPNMVEDMVSREIAKIMNQQP